MPNVYSEWSDSVQFEIDVVKPFAWDVIEVQKFLANDPTANYSFGYSVAMNADGTIAVISTIRSALGSTRGCVYHFAKISGVWTFQSKISPTASDGYGFGTSIALSGDGKLLMVGTAGGVGHVYCYHYENGTWVRKQDVYDPTSGGSSVNDFGTSVAMSSDGTIAFIGAPAMVVSGKADVGSVFIYTYNGTTWSLQKRLDPDILAPGANFGRSVAISGDSLHAAVGTRGMGGYGTIYIYSRSGTTWSQVTGSFFNGEFYENQIYPTNNSEKYFGAGVALNHDGSILFASYRNDSLVASNAGSVLVFTRVYTEYKLTTRIYASDIKSLDNFGYSVATNLAGDLLLVGAPYDDDTATATGSMYFFDTTALLDRLNEVGLMTASDAAASDFFGTSACISGDGLIALVGAPGDDDKGSASGSVYYHTRVGNVWTRKAKLTTSDGSANDKFGTAISMNTDGTIAVISQVGDDDKAADAGAVYVFTRVGDVWTQQQKIVPLTINGWGWDSNYFGTALALSGDGNELLIGVPLANGSINGTVFAYRLVAGVYTYYNRFSTGAIGIHFGKGLAISADGTHAVIGAPYAPAKIVLGTGLDMSGVAYIYKREGDVWSRAMPNTLPSTPYYGGFYPDDLVANDLFGSSCACSDDFTLIAIGAQQNGASGNYGAVYLYTFDGTNLTFRRKVKPYTEVLGAAIPSEFGSDVSLSSNGKYMLVGADKVDNGSVDAGAVYTFTSLNQ